MQSIFLFLIIKYKIKEAAQICIVYFPNKKAAAATEISNKNLNGNTCCMAIEFIEVKCFIKVNFMRPNDEYCERVNNGHRRN